MCITGPGGVVVGGVDGADLWRVDVAGVFRRGEQAYMYNFQRQTLPLQSLCCQCQQICRSPQIVEAVGFCGGSMSTVCL